MKIEDLGEVFVDGRIINLKSSTIDVLENSLKKVREQRVVKTERIANLIQKIQK